ncbi:MFS general substrate transporter [Sistotremastrum suecicum HHB10207 ss-3]|uniref:MFS general substrate transporter n=1 Tax=Sistotremastrum suecicum HHB10207 ss-3 TaxID=1314776 RepID=A0A166F0D4_9AGAM|nr:MFS general substrate transporter [Sistotremastrum suecicum HHB10207 ss-3]
MTTTNFILAYVQDRAYVYRSKIRSLTHSECLAIRNIGNAIVAGMTLSLRMSLHQVSVALTVTYVPYILMELPCNWVMKRIGANITLPIMVILWGVACTCQGAVTSYHGLIACRFFLGLAEGGILPGLILYLSSFYKREQLNLRVAFLFTATSLAGAFSGLLAAAISNMNGDRGKPGWAWIFILEGVFTVVFGIFALFVMPRRPEDTFFLTELEKEALIAQRDEWAINEEHHQFTWAEVFSTFKEPHLWIMSIGLFFGGTCLYGLIYFTPSIVQSLGHSPNRSQLLSVPPYAAAFVVSLIAAYFSDRYRARGVVLIIFSCFMIIGYGMFLGSAKKHVDYGSLFFQVVGVYTAAPTISAWLANSFEPHFKRGTAIAWGYVITNCGGILSTWIFNDAPRYRKATKINLAFSVGILVATIVCIFYLRNENAKKRKWRAANDLSALQSDTTKLGDRHPHFEYTL